MWHIGAVARLRPRLTNVYWPLLTRACLIALCGLVTAISPNLAPRIAVAPALLLLLVAALGSLPVPRTVPVWLQPLTETLAATLVVGTLRGQANLFLPYVLVPLATAGLAAGLGAALVAAGLASLVLLLTSCSRTLSCRSSNWCWRASTGSGSWMWVLIFVAVSFVGAWMRRVPRPRPARRTPPTPMRTGCCPSCTSSRASSAWDSTRPPSPPPSPTSCASWSTGPSRPCS